MFVTAISIALLIGLSVTTSTRPIAVTANACLHRGAMTLTLTDGLTAKQFDDLPPANPAAGVRVPTPYKHLKYSAFAIGEPIPGGLGLQTTSPPNAVLAPYVLTGLLSRATITTVYPGSRTRSFNLHSCAAGCFAATNNGLADPAVNCTIRFTGVKALGSKKVKKDFVFGVGNRQGISAVPYPIQPVRFNAEWIGLKAVSVTVQKAVVPPLGNATVQMGFDDFKYTVYVLK